MKTEWTINGKGTRVMSRGQYQCYIKSFNGTAHGMLTERLTIWHDKNCVFVAKCTDHVRAMEVCEFALGNLL